MTTDLVVLDTETTGLDPFRNAVWEIAAARLRVNQTTQSMEVVDYLNIQVRLSARDLHDHDPYARDLTKFDERYNPETAVLKAEAAELVCNLFGSTLSNLAPMKERPHLVGAVPSFDALRLGLLFGQYSTTGNLYEPWHYHYVCVENLIAGLTGHLPPWKSEELGQLVGVQPQPDTLRHTAMGDVIWTTQLLAAAYSFRLNGISLLEG